MKSGPVIPVAGKRTHGTTFQALKVASQVATAAVECAVYDCVVGVIAGKAVSACT